MTPYTLGLDLGSNSVGWALIARNGDAFADASRILCGVRIFPEGVDRTTKGTEQPRGQNRRQMRGQRRMHYRRRQRRRLLARVLKHAGLLPQSAEAMATVRALNPYGLRARGLDEGLPPHEFGRILMHLCQRRGFKTNRKTGKSKDDGKMAKSTTSLAEEMQSTGCRTLGELLQRRGKEFVRTDPTARRIRTQYTLRTMYEEEFKALWDKQSESNPSLRDPELKSRIHDAIFFQRKTWYDPKLIGDCELEPGEKRCPKAHWAGQQFRMLQEINALRVMEPGTGERPLRGEERVLLAEALACRKKMTFDQIRKCLHLLEGQQFNLEGRAKRDYLQGNFVETGLMAKPLAPWYREASAESREKLFDALAEVETPEELVTLALKEKMTREQVEELAGLTLPDGYFSVSLKAIRKMLPFLEPAHVCDDNCHRLCPDTPHGAGHVVSDAKTLAGYGVVKKTAAMKSLPPLSQTHKYLANPLVRRALSEMRKVVNALVREYGKPVEIVVELAREMKKPREERERLHFENLTRKKENEETDAILQRDFDVPSPKHDDRVRYRLWKECALCAYSGKPIPAHKLFAAEVQIDHILPYSRSLDDSYMNKVLCYSSENSAKGNQTPLEAFGHNTARFERILQVAANLPYPKRRRFVQKEIDLDKYIQRQLNDTRYISCEAVRYLGLLGSDVRCARGDVTSELRWQWGLTGLWPNAETRDGDHRRHAVDAVVIGLTSRATLQELSTVKYNPDKPRFEPPWENFREDVDAAMNRINVSFRPNRKLAGPLHNATGLGPVKGQENRYAHRVPLGSLTVAMISQIRDPAIRNIVEARCRKCGVDLEGTGKIGKALVEPPLQMPSGIPIKRVRIISTENTAIPVRKINGKVVKAVLPDENHHLEVRAKPDGRWTSRCVSRFEANQRILKGHPAVDCHPPDGLRFIMSLCINDLVQLTDDKTGEVTLFRVQKVSAGGHPLVLRLHTASRIKDKDTVVDKGWKTLQAMHLEKVQVDPIGRVNPCGDGDDKPRSAGTGKPHRPGVSLP
jgi:CRISPR-associated endonuclease Csn1